MNELITDVSAFLAALAVDHSGDGGRDLSGTGQVQQGMWEGPPLQRDFVCLAPRGFRNVPGGNLTAWVREYSVDFRGFGRATKDAPPERIAAAAALGQSIVRGLQACFLDASGPSTVYQGAHAFRVDTLDLFDFHELGGTGPWGWVSGTVIWQVHGRDEGAA